MRRLETDDPVYWEGYRDGQRDVIQQIRSQLSKLKRHQRNLDTLLRDPEKLAALANKDREVESAIVTAVMAMLLAEAGADASQLAD